MRVFLLTSLVAIGLFAMIFGESDDSPGLQGLGMLLIIAVVIVELRRRRFK